jgi:membrane-bound ClpP family serine protease
MTIDFRLLSSIKDKALAFSPIDLTRPVNSNFVGIGIARSPIGKHLPGKIQINGHQWSALHVNDDTIPIGGSIKIIGRRDLTLYVQSAQYA